MYVHYVHVAILCGTYMYSRNFGVTRIEKKEDTFFHIYKMNMNQHEMNLPQLGQVHVITTDLTKCTDALLALCVLETRRSNILVLH
jgi:hypothetical protein